MKATLKGPRCLVTAKIGANATVLLGRSGRGPTIDGVTTYYVSRVTRRSGTVLALSGLGGDALISGYASFHLSPGSPPGNARWPGRGGLPRARGHVGDDVHPAVG